MQSNLWILFCAIKIVNLNTKRKLDKAHCMEVEGGGIMRITRRQNTESKTSENLCAYGSNHCYMGEVWPILVITTDTLKTI